LKYYLWYIIWLAVTFTACSSFTEFNSSNCNGSTNGVTYCIYPVTNVSTCVCSVALTAWFFVFKGLDNICESEDYGYAPDGQIII